MNEQIVVAAASLLGVIILTLSALRGWQGWLAFKERELERSLPSPVREIDTGHALGGARIEMADLKERIRKLEAIASGVDL